MPLVMGTPWGMPARVAARWLGQGSCSMLQGAAPWHKLLLQLCCWDAGRRVGLPSWEPAAVLYLTPVSYYNSFHLRPILF